MRHSWITAALLLPCCVQAATPVQTASITLESDRQYHGLTETTSNPNLRFHTERIYDRAFLGLAAEVAPFDRIRERHTALTGYVGLRTDIPNTDWSLTTAGSYRKFVRSNKEWDYWEGSLHLESDFGFAVTVDYAPDYYAHRTNAWVPQISQFNQWGDRIYTFAQVGYAAFSNADNYFFGTAALGWRVKQSTIELAFDAQTLDESHRFRDRVKRNQLRVGWTHRFR